MSEPRTVVAAACGVTLALLLASVGAPANGIGAAPAHGPLYAPLLRLRKSRR